MHNPTPGLPAFDYIRPASLPEASQFLAAHGDTARPFMGGTDTFVRMRDGFWREKHLVDVKHLDGMNAITFDPENGLTLGAAVNMNRVIASAEINTHYPLLAQASRTVASYQLRSRATIVGNICNGSPAGDTTGACIVLGGVLHVHGVDGARTESLDGFLPRPWQDRIAARRHRHRDFISAAASELGRTLHQIGTQCVGRSGDCRRDRAWLSRPRRRCPVIVSAWRWLRWPQHHCDRSLPKPFWQKTPSTRPQSPPPLRRRWIASRRSATRAAPPATAI